MQRCLSWGLMLSIAGNLLVSSNVSASPTSSLVVTVNGLRNQKGQVCLSLFSQGQAQGFPAQSNRALQSQCIKATTVPLAVKFNDLNLGTYAVSVIHDENENGKFSTGFLGIPKEGFGFSRNPSLRVGAPSFGDTAFPVAGENTQIQINLKYLL